MATLTKEDADAMAAASAGGYTYEKGGAVYTLDAYKTPDAGDLKEPTTYTTKPLFEPVPVAGTSVTLASPTGASSCGTCAHTGQPVSSPGGGSSGGSGSYIVPPGYFAPGGAAAPINLAGTSTSSGGLVAWLTAPENRVLVALLALLLFVALTRDKRRK